MTCCSVCKFHGSLFLRDTGMYTILSLSSKKWLNSLNLYRNPSERDKCTKREKSVKCCFPEKCATKSRYQTKKCARCMSIFRHIVGSPWTRYTFLWPPCVADADIIFLFCSLLWSPYGRGQTIIFSSCGFFFFFFFPSPNVSCHKLDVCHTSTHGVAHPS